MPYAISLKCLNATGDPVRALWQEAGAFEQTPSMAALGYPPHLTLAVYADIEPATLHDVLEAAAAGWPPQSVTFSAIRHFDGPSLVLWAAPDETDGLHRLHADVHARLDPGRCHPHYRPGAWVPHCSLAMHIGEPERAHALAWAATRRAPFTVRFDTADCVRFYPVEVLAERPLR